MRFNLSYLLILFLLFLVSLAKSTEMTFHGISDVSAAVFLDETHFVTADDETNCLRTYMVDKLDGPVKLLDLKAFLASGSKPSEADIEAAAHVGDRIYWITSHGRNKDGKMRPSRYRFFCTHVKVDNDGPKLEPAGQICSTLVQQFLAQPSPVSEILTRATQFDASLSKEQRENLAPKEEGLNIEGLCWYRPNESLLIGLRNPLYIADGKAIVLELQNPQAVIDDAINARFGRVLLWDLEQRGIRGIEYCQQDNAFYILAGPIDSETTFALYRWEGDFDEQPMLLHVWPKDDSFSPEGIAERPSDGGLWLFSDDGSLEIPVDSAAECQPGELLDNGNCPNKYLADPTQKTFRVRTLTPRRTS